jgi:hypothetical protein
MKTELMVYYCCTNFSLVGSRLKTLYDTHSEQYQMLKPKVVSLISCEINTEKTILRRMNASGNNIFPTDASVTLSDRHKAFTLKIRYKKRFNILNAFKNIVENSRKERFQQYQMRMDAYDGPINPEITSFIMNSDQQFYEDTRPFSQSYLDCYTCKEYDEEEKFIGWKHRTSDRVSKVRSDLKDSKLSDTSYNLYKIKELIFDTAKVDKIDEMVRDGIISKNDIDALKAITKIENIDVSNIEFPDFDTDDEE